MVSPAKKAAIAQQILVSDFIFMMLLRSNNSERLAA